MVTGQRFFVSLTGLIAIGLLQTPAAAQQPTFGDVPLNYWAFDFIEILAGTGITSGCGNDNYCPEGLVTRAQMAVFLERGMNGAEFVPPAATGEVFDDVGANDFAAGFIEQFSADGITSGCGGGNYCPNDPVTRAQMAVFLLRAEHGSSYTPPAPSGQFGDVSTQHWAAAWVEQLAAEGITSGCGGGDFCPDDSVTRAQMAVFIVRTFDLVLPAELPSALYVLGDSLSDTGNAAGLVDYALAQTIYPPTIGLCNPYDVLFLMQGCGDLYFGHGRVTDGLVAVEHVAQHLGINELQPSLHIVPSRPVTGTNYAVASAKARGLGTEDLTSQVDLLLLDEGLSLPADALYIVMIGGNDVIDALQALVPGTPEAIAESAAIVDAAVDAVGDNVERLLDYGARRLIVANAPDLGLLPGVLAEAAASGDEAAFIALASGVSAQFDAGLEARLDAIEGSGMWVLPAPIARFDLSSELGAIVAAAALAGDNVEDACFDSEAYRDSPVAERIFHPDCEPAEGGSPGFDGFIFWDVIHPTGVVHAAVGAALIALIPATAP